MLRVITRWFLGFVAVCVLLGGGLLIWAMTSAPAPAAVDAIATLVPAERAALVALAERGGFDPASMHGLGGYYRGLLEAPVNRRALWVEDGHVRALRVAGWPHPQAPALAAFAELEVLWLDDGALAEWPDLSALSRLGELQLRGQPLARIEAQRLPPALAELGLARTRIADPAPLATLASLRELDLSETAVADFSALVPLALDTLDLSGSRVAALPATLPRRRHGDWSLNLDGTPVLARPGLSWQPPGGYAYTNVALGRETREGYAGSSHVDAWGTGAVVPAMRPVQINTLNAQNVYEVEVEARIGSGRARIWLDPPDGYWSAVSPWFREVDIEGFGFPPRHAWVHADLEAGRTVRLNGRLMRTGSPEHPQLEFLIEPLDGSAVTALEYHVRKREAKS